MSFYKHARLVRTASERYRIYNLVKIILNMTLKDLRSYRAVSRMCWDLYVSSVKVISTTWSLYFLGWQRAERRRKRKKLLMRAEGLRLTILAATTQFAYELLPRSSLPKASRTQDVSTFFMPLFPHRQVRLKYTAA